MRFLLSNDDGVHAPGLLALAQALSTIGEVVVVAPSEEQSGCASSLSVSKPLYAHQLPSGFVAVNGSPADCIYLALHELYRDTDFDCIVTGINSGANLGQDVLFSGTFGAALTAQIFGIPAIATSLVGGGVKGKKAGKRRGQEDACHYKVAAEEIAKLIRETAILSMCKSLPYHVLNVNIPDVHSSAEIKGRKITTLGHAQIARPVHHMVDPRGRDAYWLSLRKRKNAHAASALHDEEGDETTRLLDRQALNPLYQQTYEVAGVMTDDKAVAENYISLSPVRLHHAPKAALETLSSLAL